MADSSIVEEDYGTSEGDGVDEEWIPMIDCGAEVLEAEEGDADFDADVAVCELDVIFCGDELCFCCLNGWESHDG